MDAGWSWRVFRVLYGKMRKKRVVRTKKRRCCNPLNVFHPITRPRRSSGQYIVKQIVEKVDKLHAAGWSITIQWIPGHEGNESAGLPPTQDYIAEPLTDRGDPQSSQVLQTPRAARMEPDPRDPTTDDQSILVAVCRQRLREAHAAMEPWKLSWE